jgi:hypothetical protein
MYGLKNLVSKGILNDENYNVLKKRSEEYRRSMGVFMNHLQQINKIYEDYFSLLEKSLCEISIEMGE